MLENHRLNLYNNSVGPLEKKEYKVLNEGVQEDLLKCCQRNIFPKNAN